MKSPIDLIGGFYTVDGLNWACQDTVNYLPMAAEAGGTKTPTMLKSPPGLKPFSNIGDGPDYVIRGMHDVEGQLFVVSGNRLYQLMTTTGLAIPIGEIPGIGRVSMSHNQIAGGNQLLVVNGQSGYIYNTRTQEFQRITDPGYPGAFAADFIDGYFVQVEPFGRYVFHSNLADGLDYNTLDRFEAESQPDNIVALLVINDEVRVFGSRTQQIFTNTGAAQGTFQSKGITIDIGCAGRFTPARLDNGVFFLGDDGVVYRDNGYSPVRISTHAIEEAIADSDWSQAFAFTWQAHGHSVYYLTFPDGQTWGYDIASQLWHRRATYHPSFEVSRRWRLNALVYSRGKWYGGDSTSGRIYTLEWDYMMEGDQPLVSERTSQVTYNAGNRFQVQELEILPRAGEKPTTPGDFILQPQGPTITGDAPDQTIGVPFTYQYTVTQGDAPLVGVRVVGGSLPAGWTLSTTGLLSGVLKDANPVRVRVRVTDTNGLWDEVDDTIRGSALWWLLRTDGGDDQRLWYSNDPRVWLGAAIRTPYHQPIIGALALGDAAIIPTAITKSLVERVTDFNPAGGIATTEVTLPDFESFDNIDSARDFGDLQILFLQSGAAYYTTEDRGLTWVRRNVSGGFAIRDIHRLSSGRWISFRILAGTRQFIYSDEEIPLNWVVAPFASPTPMDRYKIACDGSQAWMLGADGLTAYKTLNGADWSLVVLGIDDPFNRIADCRAALLVAGKVVFGGQIYGVLNRTLLVGDIASNMWDPRSLVGNSAVEKLDAASGYIVASGTASGTTSYLHVSTDEAETFQPSTLPFSVSPANSGVATAVLK